MSLCFRNSPSNNYLFKVNNRNTRKRCEIRSKLTIKTPCSSVSIVDFKQVIVSWENRSIMIALIIGQSVINLISIIANTQIFLSLLIKDQFLEHQYDGGLESQYFPPSTCIFDNIHILKTTSQFSLYFLSFVFDICKIKGFQMFQQIFACSKSTIEVL